MSWNGTGFGDELNTWEVSQELGEYDAWLHKRAHQMTHPNDNDDLAQEGRIAMWKALRTWDPDKGALPSWLTTHANYAMKEAVVRKHWTGQPSRVGNLVRGQAGPLSLDALLEVADGVEAMLEAADLLDGAMWAYHQGEIAEAIDSLSPAQRRYVILRFWHDVRGSELKLVFGYEPQALWSSAKNGAKMKLQNRLGHLVGVG